MPEYPNRGMKFHAIKLTRALNKRCVANTIGVDACWLITTIALTEDAKRYSGPVTFWTGQILPATGFQSWDRLNRARKKAVEGGWLFYRSGGKSKAASYWTKYPDGDISHGELSLADEETSDAPTHVTSGQSGSYPRYADRNSNQNLIETGSKLKTSIPNPNPVPEEERVRGTRATSAATRLKYPKHFEAVWGAYPTLRRRDKKGTFAAYEDAIEGQADAKGGTAEAQTFLLKQVQLFTDSFEGQNFSPAPKKWFTDERYGQSPKDWEQFGNGSPDDDWPEVHRIVKDTFHPDLRNSSDVEAKLTANQFKAVKSIGISRVTSADKYDKDTPAAYRAAIQKESN